MDRITSMVTYKQLIQSWNELPDELNNTAAIYRDSLDNNTVSLRDYMDSSSLIRQHIEDFDIQIEAPNETVALSLFFKKQAQSIIAPLIVAQLLQWPIPQHLNHLYISDKGRGEMQWLTKDCETMQWEVFCDYINRLTKEMVQIYVYNYGYTKTDAWGSIGLAISLPWRILVDRGLAVDDLVNHYESSMRHFNTDIQSAMVAIPTDDKHVQFKRRKSCCQKYQLAGRTHCATCSKIPLAE